MFFVDQVGVKAPGSPRRMTRRPLQRCAKLTALGPGKLTSRATSGALSPRAAKVRPRPTIYEARRSANIIRIRALLAPKGASVQPWLHAAPAGLALDSQLAACKDTSKKPNASGSRLIILRFANGSKRSMGHLLGPKKINFLMSRYGRRHHGGRVGGILSIRGPEVSPRSPRVGTRHG